MKKIALTLITTLCFSSLASAAEADCAAQAAEKKLAGAAKNSFLKKCERDTPSASNAQSTCEAKAAEKKLAGAAKNSFTKKCIADATK